MRSLLFVALSIVLTLNCSVLFSQSAQQAVQHDHVVDNGDGTVTDTKTDLMWAAKDNGSAIGWDDAQKYCKNFRGGGHSDWRMPTMAELRGLYDQYYTQPAGAYSAHLTPRISLGCIWIWSSETAGSSEAHLFSFDLGMGDTLERSYSKFPHALAVRSRDDVHEKR